MEKKNQEKKARDATVRKNGALKCPRPLRRNVADVGLAKIKGLLKGTAGASS